MEYVIFLYKKICINKKLWEGDENLTQEELRNMLIERLNREKASYICSVTGINKDVLSRFKTGKIDLYPHLFSKLEEYITNP